MNPFVISGYHSPSYFCDRQEEAQKLQDAIANGRNVTLFSIRRLGKSSLIGHVAHQLKKKGDFHVIHVDLLSSQSASEFADALIKAVFEFDKKNHPLKVTAQAVMKSLLGTKLVFSTDPLTGIPEVRLEPGDWQLARKTLNAIFRELAASKRNIVLALDEFQQICHYPERGMLAEIRSFTQQFPTIRFIFSGSEESLLTRLFTDPKQPFYNSSQLMQLRRIPIETYYGFVKKHFKPLDFPKSQFAWVYEWCNGITFHIQWFCNRLYEGRHKEINSKILHETALKILDEFAFQFHAYQRILTKDQFALMRAIAKDNQVYQPTSIQFVTGHQLKLAANVQRSLKALLEKGLVQEDFDPDNKRFYFISDVFLSRWLERDL